MSTIPTEGREAARTLPDWRRLCHIYAGDSQRSVCDTATRKPGQDHTYPECTAGGHTICVVCLTIGAYRLPPPDGPIPVRSSA